MLNPSYFQYNFKNLLSGKRVWVKAADTLEDGAYAAYHSDGSYSYAREFQSRYSSEDILEKTEQICAGKTIYNCSSYTEMDPEYTSWFEKLIGFLQGQGVELCFYLPPYSQPMYDFLAAEEAYSIILQVESYIADLAEYNGIPVYGSYNPEKCGLELTDFYDPYHIRKEKIMDTM